MPAPCTRLPSTLWPAAIAAAFALALMAGTAQARGGGHGGGMGRAGPPQTHAPAASAVVTAMPRTFATPAAANAVQPARDVQTPPPINTGTANTPATASSLAQAIDSSTLINAAPPAPVMAATPPSAIGDALPELAPVAPLSPQLPEQFATSSIVRPNLALTPGSSGGSPSETAPSAPGGGGNTLADCMGFWDRGTHMTKAEWKAACVRSIQEFPSVFR
jgi:hypothetical protein